MESAKFVSMYFLNFLGEGAVVVPRRNSGRSLVVMQPWRGSKGGGVAVLRIPVNSPTEGGFGWEEISIDGMCLSRRYRHSVDGKPILVRRHI